MSLVLAMPPIAVAEARPGGGQKYSGGSSKSGSSKSGDSSSNDGSSDKRSSGGSWRSSSRDHDKREDERKNDRRDGRRNNDGGSGVGAALAGVLIALILLYPKYAIPVVALILFAFVARYFWARRLNDWTEGTIKRGLSVFDRQEPPRSVALISEPGASSEHAELRVGPMEELQRIDPQFSPVVFRDFLHHLYQRVHEARGSNVLNQLHPYVTQQAREALETEDIKDVQWIVIGAVDVISITTEDENLQLRVAYDANLTELDVRNQQRTRWLREIWTLSRKRGVKSKPPAVVQAAGCPSCGAPIRDFLENMCRSCGVAMTPGEFDWALAHVHIADERVVPPVLTGDAGERGTELPTVVAPDAKRRMEEIGARDPGFDWYAFVARVTIVHRAMNDAWTSLQWAKARPYLADTLHQSMRYWIDAYRAAGQRNVLRDVSVVEVKLADARSDPYYDAIVARVFATGLDYTIEVASNKVVSGSDRMPRPYSEYWTFIRVRGARSAARSGISCPNCGAALDVDPNGSCRYCRAHLTGGELDWTLSRIEQDDAYGT